MNKRIFALICAVLLCVISVISAFAEPNVPRLVDDAMLLEDYEAEDLLEQLDEISERQQFDVAIVTVQSLDGATSQAYADDYFDYNNFGYGSTRDGVLLLLSMEERDWYISTSGYGITAFTDAGISYIGEQIVSDFSSEFYYYGFQTFAELCDDFITQANNGAPYDVDNMPEAEFSFFGTLIIALGIGLVVAAIVCLVFALQLKSVHSQSAASNYVKPGSMHVTDSREFFLYRTVDRREKPKENTSSGGSSVHTSSSGRTHGGGGGKF